MFLKRFKEKSKQKYFKGLLKTERRIVPNSKVDSVGILLNYEEFNQIDRIRKLLKNIGFKDNKVKVLTYTGDDKDRPNSWDAFYSSEDFGWKAKLNNQELIDFIEYPFDALINYFQSDKLELNLVTAMSKAKFKIGIGAQDDRLYDLIINIDPKHVHIFESELEKYLKVLKKI